MLDLIKRAATFSNRTAIVSNQMAYSYQQLLNASGAVATYLLDGKQDLQEMRVVFLVPPSIKKGFENCFWLVFKTFFIIIFELSYITIVAFLAFA